MHLVSRHPTHLISHHLRHKVGKVFSYKLEEYSGYGIYLHFIHLLRYKVIIAPFKVISLVIRVGQGLLAK